jgi:hypothetical protein
VCVGGIRGHSGCFHGMHTMAESMTSRMTAPAKTGVRGSATAGCSVHGRPAYDGPYRSQAGGYSHNPRPSKAAPDSPSRSGPGDLRQRP